VDVVIAAGRTTDVIGRIAQGDSVGTRFKALAHPLENRKRWILAGPKAAGRVVVDAGAVAALLENGRSLLPAGITAVQGRFQRGDTISILSPAHKEVARGISRYSSGDLEEIRGRHSDDIAGRLGYAYGPVAVHRNDLILL
jgi:glutamate 5-kinase